MKNVNETQRAKPDPEKSAAAKARTPPPNPWPELKASRETVAHLNGRITKLVDEREKQQDVLANFKADHAAAMDGAIAARRKLMRRLAIAEDIIHDQHKLITELSRGWFRRDADKIATLRGRIFSAQNALAQSRENPAGNIAGLQVFPPIPAGPGRSPGNIAAFPNTPPTSVDDPEWNPGELNVDPGVDPSK